ncbi:MAG: response regulator [Opitutaceae bacterium]
MLHADDDPQIAEFVRFNFERDQRPHRLTSVNSGLRCLEAMQRGDFDLVLLDLTMPDMDGLQVLGELLVRRDSTPVIMVSGQGQHDLAVRALRAGAVDCIDKNSPDFARIPEIAHQAVSRYQRQTLASLRAAPVARGNRILYLDADPAERSVTQSFFARNAPRLLLTAEDPAALGRFLGGETEFDALVLGPHFDAVSMLNALRKLRSREPAVPVVVLSAVHDGETAIAAFKLGATDYLINRTGYLSELVFTVHNVLKQAATEQLNAQLAAELAALNRSLAEQVSLRTQELETEILVRRAAEQRAAAQAERSQALSTRLLNVQEEERRALARELHDQVGQLLTGLRFQLEAVGSKGVDLGESLALTDELLRGIRELTLQLRPRMLDDLGLKAALQWHVARFAKQTSIAVELDLSLPDQRLSAELETAAFRLVQESLTNVARHSGATTSVVTVTASEERLHVEISDRGKGFDVEAALARRDSLGLAGLAERVKLAGGELEVVTAPGQGSRLHAEFPLPRITAKTT